MCDNKGKSSLDILKEKIENLFERFFFKKEFAAILTVECEPMKKASLPLNSESYAFEITLSGAIVGAAIGEIRENLGENNARLGEILWEQDRWSFLWFLPKSVVSETENPIFTDIHGQKWISPLRVIPPEGKSKNKDDLRDEPVILGGKGDSNAWRVFSAYWVRVEWIWRRFRNKLQKKLNQHTLFFSYKSLVELEASLNAPWTSWKANQWMLRDLSEYGGVSPLLSMETRRQVNIAWDSREAGRIRLPHLSHLKRLCPYQTPESDGIGLHLFRCAESAYSLENAEIGEGKSLYSLAVGLIPYPNHSDGPRLLMGGKNLKQTEHGVEALKVKTPPKAMIPGYLESAIENDSILKIRDHRYEHTLGVDALVAIMPYEGYTYEDGLVVSSDFAKKLRLPDERRVQTEIVKHVIPKGKTLPLVQEIQNNYANELNRPFDQENEEGYIGKYYSYDEPLPLPKEIRENYKEEEVPAPRYRYRYAGKLSSCTVKAVKGRLKDGKQNEADDNGGTLLQLKISYQFTVERHLAVGDKLTGRHGNKGVVTHILETPVHTVILGKTIPIDLMISPSALMGRKNLGQLYEMTHSLLLWGKKENLFDAEEQKQLENVTEDKLLTHGEMAALLSIVKKMAGAERGNATFEIFLLGKSEPFCLAFVGFQHFVRLHHHVKAKLQYRNAKGPHNNRLGQPGSGGGSAGQRLGEMENWSCLSHPIMGDDEDSFNLLFHMRETHGEAKKTRELACSILWSLGYNVTDDAEIQRLDLKSALKPFMELGATYCMIPQEKDLFSIRKEIYSWREQEGTSIARSEIQPERRLACALNPVTSKTHSFGLKELLEKAVDNVVDALGIQVSDLSSRQLETLKNEFAESFGTEILEPQIKSTKDKVEDERLQEFLVFRTKEKAKRNLEAIFLVEGEKIFLPVALDVLYQHTDAANAFLNMVNAFYRFSEALAYGQQLQENALGLVGSIKKPQDPKLQALKPKEAKERFIQGAIITYRNALSGLLKGKMGLLRRHLLGRRLNHSGRGVIVPCPDLELDQVRLPHSLFLGILTNQTRKRLNGGNLEKIDLENLNALLEAKPVWLILIRQPSLHRHNFLTFRASCWDKDAIGIPPFVTLGYNADFDGDTMAIFLPPEPYASNLSHMTLLRNPGFVGTGQLALATGSDLALGWMAIYLKKRGLYKKYIEAAGLGSASNVFLSLGELLGGFFKKNLGNVKNLRKKLLALQQDICRESTGSATMTPAEFEELHKEMKECMGKNRSLSEKDAELKLKEWVEIHHHDSDLARFVHYKVKGGEKELRVMTAFVGEQSDYMKNEPQATFDQSRIDHSFWEGLSDEEMFRYAYASRSAMASKKLDVAQAGHLSYLLAEGLYETRIVEERCDADEGMKIGWEKDTLYVTLNKKDKTSFPLQGYACEKNLAAALGRIAWGRELLRTPKRLLSESDIAKIAVFWTGREGQNREELEEILDEENALWIRSPLTCKTKGGRNVCGACIGADPASRPYDKPTLMTLGSRVGLTAAQSIGERGTQLAMKRFHDTSSTGNIKRGNDKDLNEDSCQAEIGLKSFERIQTSIDVLRSLLINGYDAQGRDFKGYSNTSLKRFTLLIEYVLTESGGGAFEELPQQLIHFELALKAPRGLESWSKEATGRWLSALAYGNITTLKNHAVAESPLCENWGIKSRLMWDAIGA